jgi:hypothetical protein
MFEDGETIIVEGEGGEDTAATDAARAESSAQAASEAAQTALVMADVSAAQVEQNAAERTAEFEARLNECQELARIATQSQTDLQSEVGQLRTEMGTTREALELILSRLPPEQPQANQENGQSAQEEPGGEPAAATDKPAEPAPAAKRRAHRWI